ncbi:drug/metabolite transporter (DMT)-like permease [Deinobacterium chartae]|uniref:Drug/metabolite transporter (DMT)-like permease n=1 Tax=Deinobacterium chartae TaxID=521158 RepID=A0A841I4E8_9DEIO|nr:EamA family transporter [Deinobacterium chartae]MBB6099278.1 drug/metabolite transporter (DMT)-like permease [Deinobacterium chartae]
MVPPRLHAALLALFVTFLWSTSWVLIKLGLHDLPPLPFAGLRYALAFLCLLPFALLEGTRTSRWPGPRELRGLVLLGLVQYTLTQGAQFLALAYLPATTLSLLLTFTPALVAALAAALLRESLTAAQAWGTLLLLGGAALYFGPQAGSGVSPIGLAVALIGLLANASQVLLGRAFGRAGRLSALQITTVSMGAGAAALLSGGTLTQGWPVLTEHHLLLLGWLAVVNTALAFTLWNVALRHLSALEASLINNTMLVQIALLALVFLNERPSAVQWAGMALALVGVVIAQRFSPPRPQRPRA